MYRQAVFVAAVLSCTLTNLSCAAREAVPAEKATIQEIPYVTYRVGMKTIAVPPPADLRETGPDYRVLFEHNAPDTNRLVAAFLPPEDVAKLPARLGGLNHYAFVETLRQAEFVEIDSAKFKEVTDAVAKQFGTSTDSPALDVKAFQDEFNHKLKAEGSTSEISLDKPVSLGMLFVKANASSFAMVMNVSSGEKSAKMIIGTTLLRVQNRLLYAAVYAVYSGDDSAAWVRTTSEQWADAILKANLQ